MDTTLTPTQYAPSAISLQEDVEQQVAQLTHREIAAQSPAYFGSHYLSHHFQDDAGRDVASAGFHFDLYEAARTHERVLTVAPREHAKTTTMSLVYPAWAATNPEVSGKHFIVLFGATIEKAKEMLEAIRVELELNPAILADYGKLVGRTWTTTDVELRNGVRISARSRGSKVRGLKWGRYRPDLVICDDLEDDESVQSPEGRRKTYSWFKRVLMNLSQEMQVFVIGNILHNACLLSRLLEDPDLSDWYRVIYRAICPDGRPLWPAKWPLSALEERRREIGSLTFAQEFQNQPMSEEELIFKPEWIRYYDEAEIRNEVLVRFMAADLAISQSEGADYFAVVVVGISSAGVVYVLDSFRARLGVLQQAEALLAKYQQWQPMLLGVEANQYQKALVEVVDALGQQRQVYPPTVPITNTANKVLRISRRVPLVENHTVRFRREDQVLIDELLALPRGAHEDVADAWDMAIELAAGAAVDYEDTMTQPTEAGAFDV